MPKKDDGVNDCKYVAQSGARIHRLSLAVSAAPGTGEKDLEDDHCPLPESPGLGVEFDQELVSKYPFKYRAPPHGGRRDGSYTNCKKCGERRQQSGVF